MSTEIKVTLTSTPKEKPQGSLGFGKIFTDHMFVMDYNTEKGWHDARIVPYGPITMEPSMMALHYGQEVFEGMKAYRTPDGKIRLFRAREHIARLNRSSARVCIPPVDEEFLLGALKKLIQIEKDWVPSMEGTSLYIRPFIFATDEYLGVRPSSTYKLMIILNPVGAYYAEGFKPVKIWVETKYARTVAGGTGEAKTAANYAASLFAAEEAKKQGYSQVLWLDGIEKKYIEEVGAMNIFFKIDNKIVTPALNGSILAGMTRNSVLKLAKDLGFEAVEARISVDEIYKAHAEGKLQEVFGTGTAAVISPVSTLCRDGEVITINNGEVGETALRFYNEITGIQFGKIPDRFEWTEEI